MRWTEKFMRWTARFLGDFSVIGVPRRVLWLCTISMTFTEDCECKSIEFLSSPFKMEISPGEEQMAITDLPLIPYTQARTVGFNM